MPAALLHVGDRLTSFAEIPYAEFRENRNLADPGKTRALLAEAHTGLLTLRSQSGLANKSSDLDFKFGEHG